MRALRWISTMMLIDPCKGAVYDRAITIFSPDGKLMQVSYAEEAVQRGKLAVAACNGRDAIVMCVERPSDVNADADADGEDTGLQEAAAKHEDTEKSVPEGEKDREDGGVDSTQRRHRRRRHKEGAGDTGVTPGVGIVDDANNQDRKLCEVDEGVFLAFAGISADGRVLASKIRLECQSYRYSMGTPPSVGYIAKYVGSLQHRFTRTGGARPYGVSCLLVGFDENASPRVFRSEPSGAFAEWVASAVGQSCDKALGKLESVPEMSALDWRGTAEATVRAALAGGASECDVLVLRQERSKKVEEEEGGTGLHGGLAGVGGGDWGRRGSAWTRRFVGSVGGDGRVVLKAGRDVDVEDDEEHAIVL